MFPFMFCQVYTSVTGRRATGMVGMLDGLKLELVGRHHSGIGWCHPSREFGRTQKFVCGGSGLHKLSRSLKCPLMFASGYVNNGTRYVSFLKCEVVYPV